MNSVKMILKWFYLLQGKQAQSKGGILAKACEYLAETRNANDRLRDSLKNAAELTTENERLNTELQRLQRENAVLQQQIQRSHLKAELDFNM
ncbi:upstream stimulatory factor 2 [Eurytemora carolleeae]|uniref:upstream stimulatory factor 2 n=1 Tax=Eurytemora carolleeae TaxID=1294199 RepID=UPI000C776B99|nr:upstream stimulatory factor 2 [Eurytemora carolleeae]|eukprot:XP_023331504.1 upstream stimulatory factor 2-like [Eurytemora affinis]